MPNWVYNNLSVSGNKEDLLAFAEKASRQHATLWLTDLWVRNTDGTNTRVPEEDRAIEEELSGENVLSFWNFVAPTEEEIPYYFGHKTKAEDVENPDATQEERMAKAMTFSGSGWYDWNIRNWGVKWDAGEADLETDLDELSDTDILVYRFQTAWGIPTEALTAMVRQHPELDFYVSSEEEQGWGAEFTSSDGDEDGERSLITTDEWNIPDCHADYVARDNEDGCSCSHNEDEDDWYDDCPREETDFYVVVTKTYRVKTNTAENAWELAQDNDPDEQMELVEDNTAIFIADENGKRLYPTLGDGSLMSEPDEITDTGEVVN